MSEELSPVAPRSGDLQGRTVTVTDKDYAFRKEIEMTEPVMTFDKEANAIYVKVKDGPVKKSMSPIIKGARIDIVLDYDGEDRIVGIEILL